MNAINVRPRSAIVLDTGKCHVFSLLNRLNTRLFALLLLLLLLLSSQPPPTSRQVVTLLPETLFSRLSTHLLGRLTCHHRVSHGLSHGLSRGAARFAPCEVLVPIPVCDLFPLL